MSLLATINDQIAAAMRQKQGERVAVLRLLKNTLKNEQIKLGRELEEVEEAKVMQREAKQRRDSIEAFNKGGRPELAAAEQAELQVITEFLPAQMNDEELEGVIQKVIEDVSASSMADMGAVIGAVMKRVGGQADGANVSRIVRQKLGS